MQVSCKVSYSIIVYVERQGVQLERFFEKFDSPVELLKDPSGWVELTEMDTFMDSLAQHIGVANKATFFREIGQKNYELRAWGVLDSVLKMVESPQDIFMQPDRFLSYFLTPAPEFHLEKKSENQLSFMLYKEPYADNVLSYLMGAVEGIPNYTGAPMAQIQQVDNLTYQITWSDKQESLFDEQEQKRRQFHPEIVQSVMQSLQEHQKNIVEASKPESSKNIASEAFERMVSLEVEKRLQTWVKKQKEFDESFFKIKNDFYKMYDYFVRAQQIITLISPTARKASVREAMRRVDWEHIQKEFPLMVESACDSILAMKGIFPETQSVESAAVDELTYPVDLNELINSVLEDLSFEDQTLKVDRKLHLDRPVMLEPQSFAQALGEVFQNSLKHSSKEARVEVVTRASGGRVQIEIRDQGFGLSEEKLQQLFDRDSENNLKTSQDIIMQHKGQISVSSCQGQGSTYLIELPH